MEAKAHCKWFWRAGIGKEWNHEADDEAECRATIGKRIVTVWLPQGAKIRLRLPRHDERCGMDTKFVHWYGRDHDNKIEIRLSAKN